MELTGKIPEHIDTIVQGPCFVWHVLEDCVDIRYTPLEEAQTQIESGAKYLHSDDVVTVNYSAFDGFTQDDLYSYIEREGLLHVMNITYRDGSSEEVTTVSLKPLPPPPTPERMQEALEWAKKIRANALDNIVDDL